MIDSSATTGIFEYPIHGTSAARSSAVLLHIVRSSVQKTDLCDGGAAGSPRHSEYRNVIGRLRYSNHGVSSPSDRPAPLRLAQIDLEYISSRGRQFI
jgi:hypothetical protein